MHHIRCTDNSDAGWAARLRTHVSTPLGGEGVESIDEGETVINNRIGVAYCARLPIPHPSLSPPYSRISRAIKHVRPFIGPCTFTKCVCMCVYHRPVQTSRGSPILVPVVIGRLTTWPAFAKAIKSAGGHDLFLLSSESRTTIYLEPLNCPVLGSGSLNYRYIYARRMDLARLLDPS